MELTIEQALQQGVAAHNVGNLQEAERAYRAILQSQPKHPDANHNLGLIAISVNQVEAALALFKTALDVKPNIEQFWMSYIDALVKNNQLKDAKQAIKKAKKKGFDAKKLQVLLSQSKGVTDTKAPSQAQLNSLLGHYQNGRLSDAEKLATSISHEFPSHNFSWKVLGAVFKATGRKSEALNANQTAVALFPEDAEAHSNLGSMLKELGRLDEAEASYTQAIELKPDFAEAYSNLGNTLKELGRLDEALSVYIQAISLNPEFTNAYVNLGIAIKNVRFNSSNVKLYQPLIQLLTSGNFTRPKDVACGILSLLKYDPLIKDLLLEKSHIMSLKEATSIIGSLDKLTLLHRLMRVCPLPDLQFERFFVTMRSLLLKNLDNIEASPELIYFLSTLSLHCFSNEYIYAERDEETELVENLEIQITHAIAKSEQPEAIKILCLASYRPLHHYDWCQKLEVLDHLEEVKKRLIEEPLAEKLIANDIAVLGEISDGVSLKVRAQYEENPYPRWVKLAISIEAKSISKVCDEVNLHFHSESIKNVTAPAILIAGCGTGQHSIGTASRFSGCQVTAVDLSLASLAYAKRKTAEFGITNLEYLQADILQLDQLEQKFDIIESVGVLHHMDEPMAGWRVLTDHLKPDGLMRIGLYSELARQNIVEIRKEITLQKVGTSESDIRAFRLSLAESHDENHQLLITSGDFFSLSTLRDLLFHVQEHRFTLPQIKNCLDELGLKFCGFENTDAILNFRGLYGEEADIYDLALWHQYEESNLRAFAGMYQFWCQKIV